MRLVKHREGKVSHRSDGLGRVWIADRELEQTDFTPGNAYNYSVKEEEHKVVIMATKDGERKVAHRKVGEDAKQPIIDIKNLRVKNALKDCDYITISIYNNMIVVQGHKKTQSRKLKEYQTDRNPLQLTSFSFFDEDYPAIGAGFKSKGFLVEEEREGVTFTIPLAKFQADILPKSDVWFVKLQGTEYQNANHVAHLIRLFGQVERCRKPYSIVVSNATNSILPFVTLLKDEGYHVVELDQNVLCSVVNFSPTSTKGNIYTTTFNHLQKGLQNIQKRLNLTVTKFFGGCVDGVALQDADYNILASYDLNKELAATIPEMKTEDFANPEGSYRLNIGDHFVPANLYELDYNTIPESDVMIFSPQCKGLTKANRINGAKARLLDNPKNRGMLVTLDIIKTKRPPVFMIEQVEEILNIEDGVFVKELTEELPEYSLDYQTINAMDCGAPQSRRRAIIVGSRLGHIKLPTFKVERYMTVGEALAGITEDMYNQQDVTQNKPKTIERMSHVPPGGNWADIPVHLRTPNMGKATQSNVYRRLDPDKPSITLTNFRKALIIHPFEDRGLSVREAARLMGLPDLYEFVGTLSEKQQQIANGICYQMMYKLAEFLREHFERWVFSDKKEDRVPTVSQRQEFVQLALFS